MSRHDNPKTNEQRSDVWVLSTAGVAWLAVVCFGLFGLWAFATMPGETGAAPERWPAEAAIARDDSEPTLVMFVHPRCPCSRASLGELARIMASCEGRLTARVEFLEPEGFDDDWTRTDLWQAAAAIPGVTVMVDRAGEEAGRFGAATSGQVLLYDASGLLRFAGGITVARGHAGDSPGRDAILSAVLGGADGDSETPVFGCPLVGPHETCRKESR